MAEYQTIQSVGVGARAQIDQGLRAHMNKVYGLMSVAMLITGAAAWSISGLAVTTDAAQGVAQIGAGEYLTSFGQTLYASPLKWVVMFLPLVLVFAFSAMINRMSVGAAQLFFYVYALAMGLSLSSIFLVYTGTSIAQTFLITAIAFAGLSLYGYTTKRDLSGMGTFLMMGLIGLIIASIVNMFWPNGVLYWIISAAGVLLFSGLIAFDTQRLKMSYYALGGDKNAMGVATSYGALSLFINFVNLFLFLLRFMGGNRN